jgi:hypothetical protein
MPACDHWHRRRAAGKPPGFAPAPHPSPPSATPSDSDPPGPGAVPLASGSDFNRPRSAYFASLCATLRRRGGGAGPRRNRHEPEAGSVAWSPRQPEAGGTSLALRLLPQAGGHLEPCRPSMSIGPSISLYPDIEGATFDIEVLKMTFDIGYNLTIRYRRFRTSISNA